MKRKTFMILTGILVILAIFCVAFIFGNSLKDSKESTEQTMLVKDVLDAFCALFGIDKEINPSRLRSFAHVAEFFALSFCLAEAAVFVARCTGRLNSLRTIIFVSVSAGVSILISIIDELIQRSSEGRACELKDVGLDCVGIVFGCLFAFALYFISSRIHRRIRGNMAEK